MNLSEFKVWFEGFTESLSGAPSKKQWERIQAKVAEIKDAPPISYPVYIDRWIHPYWREYWRPWYSNSGGIGMSYTATAAQAQCNNSAGDLKAQYQSFLGMKSNGETPELAQWNSGDAFKELGRAEAMSLTN